jgi:hypothetical protein
MPIAPPLNPGKVDWTGENPGILLKDGPDGPFTAMALFFRIVYSPAGRGHALLLFEDPNVERSLPDVRNVMMTDNEPLARYLMDTFIGKLAAFAEAPAFKALQYVPIDEVRCEGDAITRYEEAVSGGGIHVRLVWEELGEAKALELPPSLTGVKDRELFTLLIESRKASIIVDGKPLKGELGSRVQAGLETTTAFLYFAETWIWPEA